MWRTKQNKDGAMVFWILGGDFSSNVSLKNLETTFCFWFRRRRRASRSKVCLAPLGGNLHLQHSSSPLSFRLHRFLSALRYAKVLFSSVLVLGLWEVVSVVNQFSHVSKVNTLCVTQICKCFHYNTGFSLDTYRVCLLPESRRQPLSVEHSRFAPNSGGDNIKAVHAGGWICILWVSDHWPKQQRHVIQSTLPWRPRFPRAFCGISKQRPAGET